MHVVLVERSRLPALQYGGTERVVWWLAKGLKELGHQVTLIAGKGSECPFAHVVFWNEEVDFQQLIPVSADLVHFHFPWSGALNIPHLFTVHGNGQSGEQFHINSIFVSRNHAERHHAEAFVYNGLDPADYPGYQFAKPSDYMHFLGHAAWKVKNLKGAIEVAGLAKQRLKVGGGSRLNLNMGIRFYPQLHVRFMGMVGGESKDQLLRSSRAMIFPVRWHEPFGLAITESMLYGNPIFGTPYGSLIELVNQEVGALANSAQELSGQVNNWNSYSRRRITEWVLDQYTYIKMARKYLHYYEQILSGHAINANAPFVKETASGLLPWS